MSLLVWLPLLGNLKNQGTTGATFSIINDNSKLAANDSGKIGKCYERTASATADTIRSSLTYNLNNDISMACWAYVSSTPGDSANGLITNHSHSDNTGVGITVKQVSTTDYRISCNTGTGSSRTFNTYYGTTNIKNAWHHLALTYSKSAKVLKLWVDGIVEYTLSNYTNSSKADYFDLFNWSTSYYTSGSYRPVCKLNDVRLYDHCLSAAEVKELAKGLVCHYKLNDFYSKQNLIVNGNGDLGTENWSNGNISTSEIPSGHSEIKASMYTGNRTTHLIPIIKSHSYTMSGYVKAISGASGTAYPSILPYDVDQKFIQNYHTAAGFNNSYRTTLAQPLKKGDTVIYATDLSAWTTATNNYYFHVAIFGYKDSRGNVYPDMVYTQDSPAFGTYSDKSHINKTNNTITLNSAFTGEDRPAGTTICQATEGSTYYYPWGGVTVSSVSSWTAKSGTFIPDSVSRLKPMAYMYWYTNNSLYIAGNTLVDNSAVSTNIPDSSGYGNYGTQSGDVTISIDTPRYDISTKFASGSHINTPALSTGGFVNTYTFSWWAKYSNYSGHMMWGFSNGNRLNLYMSSGNFYWNTGDGTNNPFSVAASTYGDNKWHHFAVTGDGTTTKLYIDGVFKANAKTYKGITGTTIYMNGWDSGASYNFNGQLSDFRLYGTCLSADDILCLYNTAGKITNNGDIITYEFNEVL